MCEKCVEDWRKMGKHSCPYCRNVFKKTPKLHIFMKEKLEEYIFVCTKCIESKQKDCD